MKPYSQDLRQRVLHSIDAGQSQAVVAQMFSISIATIKRYLKARREVGHVLPKAIPGRPAVKGTVLRAHLQAQTRSPSRRDTGRALSFVSQSPWDHGQPGEYQSDTGGIGLDPKKKILRACEQNEAERAVWREQARQLPTQDLVIVDETGSRINMTPLYAYAPRGKRAISTVPRYYGANPTLIASLSVQGTGEAMLLDGSADAAAFEAYVEQILAPILRPGQIVTLDNLSIHLGSRVKRSIAARGCRLLFLPAYSPDFSPIEGAFSKLKTILRRVGARASETLQDAIIQALPTIPATDTPGWFQHCGYPAAYACTLSASESISQP